MNARLEIRRASDDLIDDVRDLILVAYAKWLNVTPRKPRPMTANYHDAFREHRFDCLYSNGVLAGVLETVPQDDQLVVVNVAVDPKHQGLGYGFRLMRYAEELAKNAKLSGTRLRTNKLMQENIALYERLGYQFEKETHHDQGTVAVHMFRPLLDGS